METRTAPPVEPATLRLAWASDAPIPSHRALQAVLGALVTASLGSCVPAPLPLPPSVSGLRPLSFSLVSEGTRYLGHSREVVVDGDWLYVADSNGLPTLRWNGVSLELARPVEPERSGHCSSLALHEASRTLLCTAADGGGLIDVIDVSDPAAPISRAWPHDSGPPYSVPDVAVEGDTAWLATNVHGLMRALIGPDGTPGPAEAIPSGTAVVQVAVTNGRVVYLDRVEGLVVLDSATLERLGSSALPGPPLDLAVDGDRLVVSLGSEGVVAFTLDAAGRPEPLLDVQPRCVATAADLDGDLLAVACLSGVTLYDLVGEAPRVAGFVPSRFGMLDVEFTPFGLVVVDWFQLDVYSAHADGVATVPDAPRGMRLAPGLDARIPIRNVGGDSLEVSWALTGSRRTFASGSLTLAPFAEELLAIPYASLAAAGSTENRADVVFSSPSQDVVSRTRVWHRGLDDEPARGHVSVGDAFPSWTRSSPSDAPAVLPIAGQATLMMFLTVDCFLQWPQLEDLAWARDHGTGQAAPTILFLTTWNEDPFDPSSFMVNFGAERLLVVEWADYLGSVPGSEVEPAASRFFDQSFSSRLPGADFPHDYVLDAAGIVTATSRLFRGRWPLGE